LPVSICLYRAHSEAQTPDEGTSSTHPVLRGPLPQGLGGSTLDAYYYATVPVTKSDLNTPEDDQMSYVGIQIEDDTGANVSYTVRFSEPPYSNVYPVWTWESEWDNSVSGGFGLPLIGGTVSPIFSIDSAGPCQESYVFDIAAVDHGNPNDYPINFQFNVWYP
jgi:hypothetical protein